MHLRKNGGNFGNNMKKIKLHKHSNTIYTSLILNSERITSYSYYYGKYENMLINLELIRDSKEDIKSSFIVNIFTYVGIIQKGMR